MPHDKPRSSEFQFKKTCYDSVRIKPTTFISGGQSATNVPTRLPRQSTTFEALTASIHNFLWFIVSLP